MQELDERDGGEDEYPQILHGSGLFSVVCFRDYFYDESRGRQGRLNVPLTIHLLAERFSLMKIDELLAFGRRVEERSLSHGTDSRDRVMHSHGRITGYIETGHWDEPYTHEGLARQVLGYLYEIDNKTLANIGRRDFLEMLPADQAEGLIARLSGRIIHVVSDVGMREDIPYLLSDGTIIYPDQG